MENSPVIQIIGSNPRPEDIDKLSLWYNDIHLPMLMKYGVQSAERFKILAENADYPAYVNIYHFANLRGYAQRQGPQASAEISKDVQSRWPNGYGVIWRPVYYEHRKWSAPGAGPLNPGSVIHVVGVSGPGKQADREFNEWYDSTHVPWLMKSGTIAEAARYRITQENREYPTYLAIYSFEDRAKYEEFTGHPERVAAVRELNEHWPHGIGSVWRVQYQLLKAWKK